VRVIKLLASCIVHYGSLQMAEKSVLQWTVEDCVQWLDSVGMPSVKDTFRGM